MFLRRCALAAAFSHSRRCPRRHWTGCSPRRWRACRRRSAAWLGLLAEGSPGRAAALAEQGGVQLYRRLIGLVGALPALDARPLHELADGLSGRDSVDRLRTLAELILWWLGRSIRAAARGELRTMEEVVPGERASAALLEGAALDRWVGVWENLRRSFAEADGLNLDPRQVLIGAFAALQEAARA